MSATERPAASGPSDGRIAPELQLQTVCSSDEQGVRDPFGLGAPVPFVARSPIYSRTIDKAGYVQVKVRAPAGYQARTKVVAEHRLVLEAVLDRPLRKGESVHHKNGIRHDNRPENLELWVGPIRYGQRAADIQCGSCGAPYLAEIVRRGTRRPSREGNGVRLYLTAAEARDWQVGVLGAGLREKLDQAAEKVTGGSR